MRGTALAATLAIAGGLIAVRVLPWLRAGRHRYPDELDRPERRHTWTVPAAALAAGAMGLGHRTDPALALVLATFAVFLVLICAIDLDVQRLPNRWTMPALLAAPAATGMLAGLDRDASSWLRALLAGVVLGLGYLVLHLLGRGSAIGLGDVKLAPSIGTVLGYQSWEHVYTATMLAVIAGGLAALALVITRRIGLRERFAFGPAMAFGAIVLMAAPLR